MQPVEIALELDASIEPVAKERGLALARDTHYDAFNIEMKWWKGNQLHRLDFQPFPEGYIVVTYLLDTYPFLGKRLRGTWRFIPMFPYLARTEHKEQLGTLKPRFDSRDLRADNKRFHATPSRFALGSPRPLRSLGARELRRYAAYPTIAAVIEGKNPTQGLTNG